MGRVTLTCEDARNVPTAITPNLIWTDIPYNTGKRQTGMASSYTDRQPAETLAALDAWSRILHSNGVMAVCCDYRMAWRVCAQLQHMVYMGEIVWQFGLGRPREDWWPNRHNNILTFHVAGGSPRFNPLAVPRTQRLAPKPGYPDDKPAGSVWDYTLSNTHPERIGYPNQKPLAVVEPFILAHTIPGDLVADPFCGSSTTGVAALRNGCNYYGNDNNPTAIAVSRERLKEWDG